MNGSRDNGNEGKGKGEGRQGKGTGEEGRRSGSGSQVIPLLLLAAVVFTHYGYGAADSWGFYILRGVEGTVLFLVLAQYVRRSAVGLFAVTWGALEEFQTAACGLLAMRDASGDGDLCVQVFGPFPYAAFCAWLFVWWWSHARKN